MLSSKAPLLSQPGRVHFLEDVKCASDLRRTPAKPSQQLRAAAAGDCCTSLTPAAATRVSCQLPAPDSLQPGSADKRDLARDTVNPPSTPMQTLKPVFHLHASPQDTATRVGQTAPLPQPASLLQPASDRPAHQGSKPQRHQLGSPSASAVDSHPPGAVYSRGAPALPPHNQESAQQACSRPPAGHSVSPTRVPTAEPSRVQRERPHTGVPVPTLSAYPPAGKCQAPGDRREQCVTPERAQPQLESQAPGSARQPARALQRGANTTRHPSACPGSDLDTLARLATHLLHSPRSQHLPQQRPAGPSTSPPNAPTRAHAPSAAAPHPAEAAPPRLSSSDRHSALPAGQGSPPAADPPAQQSTPASPRQPASEPAARDRLCGAAAPSVPDAPPGHRKVRAADAQPVRLLHRPATYRSNDIIEITG